MVKESCGVVGYRLVGVERAGGATEILDYQMLGVVLRLRNNEVISRRVPLSVPSCERL